MSPLSPVSTISLARRGTRSSSVEVQVWILLGFLQSSFPSERFFLSYCIETHSPFLSVSRNSSGRDSLHTCYSSPSWHAGHLAALLLILGTLLPTLLRYNSTFTQQFSTCKVRKRKNMKQMLRFETCRALPHVE